MSPEPKKPIEDLLEASARARRAQFGSDAPMPNPMRARLHDEIAGMEREKAEKPARPRGFSIWWPRIALATAVTVIAVGAPVFWLKRTSHSGDETLRLAIQEPIAATAPVSAGIAPEKKAADTLEIEPPASVAVAAVPGLNGDRFADAKTRTAPPLPAAPKAPKAEENASSLQRFAKVTISPSKEAPNADAKSLSGEQEATKRNATSIAGASALAPGRKMELSNFRQQFSQNSVNANQSARFNSKLKQAISVLNTFQIEQNGNQIRVVDADGSAYTGKIEPLAQTDSRSLFKNAQNYAANAKSNTAQRGKDEQASGTEFFFRASGYNGSLKKKLIFEGNYISAAPPQDTAAGNKAGVAPDQEQNSARIVGTARISGESPVQVDAVSVGP